jgi:hypothetical protein
MQFLILYRGRVIHRVNQLHETGFIKLETVVSSKNAVVLNWRSHSESHETTVAQLLEHESKPNGFLKL